MTWPRFTGVEAVCWRWRAWIRPLVISVYVLLLIVALPLCIWELHRKGAPRHVQAWFIGGLFVMFAVPISLWGIVQHLFYYTQPPLQRCIIRILWMVPVYALSAWVGLRFPDAAIYLDTMRECYEAYVIYNFMSYLLHYLNNEHMDLDLLLENKRPVKHLIPFCCLPTWSRGQSYIQRCKHGVLQYTVVRPTMTIIALICEFAHVYDEGDFNFKTAWSYLVIINNVSQIWAMYCLIMFYRATKEELRPINPVPKFLCIKAVVFLTFWQSLFIAVLIKVGVISEKQTWEFYNVKSVATGLQDFLICIEMFLAAVAHYFSFSHKPYMDMAAGQSDCWTSFLSMWDITDVTVDVTEHLTYVGNRVKKTVSLGRPLQRSLSSEQTPLLSLGNGSNQSGDDDELDSDNNQSTKYAVGTSPHTPPIHITAADLHSNPIDQKRSMKSGYEGAAVAARDTEDTDCKVYESSMEHSLADVHVRMQHKSFTMSMSNYYEGSISSADSGYIQHSNTWTAINNNRDPVVRTEAGAVANIGDKNTSVIDDKSNTNDAFSNEQSINHETLSDTCPEYSHTDSDPSSDILAPLENVSEQLNDLMLMDSSYSSASASTYPILSEYGSDFIFSANKTSNSGTLVPDEGDNAPMLFHRSQPQSDDNDDDDECFQSLADVNSKNSDKTSR